MSQFDDLVGAFLSLYRDTEFDPSQKRADDGEWTDGGGGGKVRNTPKLTNKQKLSDIGNINYQNLDLGPEIGGGSNGARIGTLPDGNTVVLKDVEGRFLGNGHNEVAAYKLSETLGISEVPETVYADVGILKERLNTAQQYVPGETAFELRKDLKEIVRKNEREFGNIIVFDYIVSNSDRHLRNIIIDSDGKPHAIDNDTLGNSSRGTSEFLSGIIGRKLTLDAANSSIKSHLKKWKTITHDQFVSSFSSAKGKTFDPEFAWDNFKTIVDHGTFPE
jgi:hypothetical protein